MYDLKSIHFRKIVGRISFLSKLCSIQIKTKSTTILKLEFFRFWVLEEKTPSGFLAYRNSSIFTNSNRDQPIRLSGAGEGGSEPTRGPPNPIFSRRDSHKGLFYCGHHLQSQKKKFKLFQCSRGNVNVVGNKLWHNTQLLPSCRSMHVAAHIVQILIKYIQ